MEKPAPTATETTPDNPAGTLVSPLQFRPHATTVPSALRAIAWLSPVATPITLDNPSGGRSAASPHHSSLPLDRTTKLTAGAAAAVNGSSIATDISFCPA